MPTLPGSGYYDAENVNYPRKPSFIGGIVDSAGNPAGVGSNMMGDPYSEEEISAASRAPLMKAPGVPLSPMGQGGTPGVTTLQPSRTQPFSRADAQALHALDPRALAEAKAMAALPESTPAKMTGSFGGKSFEMQPSARVDRNALAKLYAAAQERKGQERQDSVRAQEQGGRERIVSIPGEQATKRRGMELETEERITGKKLEGEAPERAARIAASQAQTAAATGAEGRAQAQAARQPSPQQEAIDAALAEAQASPFAQTPEGRARIAALAKRSTAGQAVPESVAGVAGPLPDVGQAAAEVMADPGIAAIIARAKETTPGMFTGGQGRQTGAAARQLAERAITARLTRAGVSPEDIQAVITSALGASSASPSATVGGMATNTAQMASGSALPIGLIGSLVR